jgi:hypothetical protein
MADPKMSQRTESDKQRAWLIGGALLLTSVVFVAAQPGIPTLFGGRTLTIALFAAALLIFAFGIRGSGSVTKRQPLGTAALALLAAWMLLGAALDIAFSSVMYNSIPGVQLAFAYADSFVQFALALIAVMQIGRLRVVPAPWNWVPAWSLGAVSLIWLMIQLAGVVAGAQGNLLSATYILSLDVLVRTGSIVLMGVLAIVLADRMRRRSHVDLEPVSAK